MVMDKELIDKGIHCLIENLGYNAANEFLHQIVKIKSPILIIQNGNVNIFLKV